MIDKFEKLDLAKFDYEIEDGLYCLKYHHSVHRGVDIYVTQGVNLFKYDQLTAEIAESIYNDMEKDNKYLIIDEKEGVAAFLNTEDKLVLKDDKYVALR